MVQNIIQDITATDIPDNYFHDPYQHVIQQALIQNPRAQTRFFKCSDSNFGVYDPDLGFGYFDPDQAHTTDWSNWIVQQELPMLAGELNSHYALLAKMGEIIPEDYPKQVMCRHEGQDFCIHTQPLNEKMPSTLKLKLAEAGDVDKLFHFYQRSETMQARSRESLLFTIQNNRLFYLQKLGKIVSAAMTHCESNQAALIGGVYTPAIHRGKGYGYICMQALMDSLKSDHKVPTLFYEKNNTAARRLYQKLGFALYSEWILIELSYELA